MKITLSYPLAGLHEAAQFIWTRNASVHMWPSKPQTVFDVQDQILEMMRRDAARNATLILKERQLKTDLSGEWNTYTGTGGFYVTYELYDENDDEIRIGASILVDPAVSHPEPTYVTEELDVTGKLA